jgi:DNA polymerase-1
MPDDLMKQFPIAKELTEAMGIKYIEVDNYEADDIIGTIAKEIDENDDFIGTIVSSEKDLLQLISNDIDVKLLKSTDFVIMNQKTFYEEYGLTLIK